MIATTLCALLTLVLTASVASVSIDPLRESLLSGDIPKFIDEMAVCAEPSSLESASLSSKLASYVRFADLFVSLTDFRNYVDLLQTDESVGTPIRESLVALKFKYAISEQSKVSGDADLSVGYSVCRFAARACFAVFWENIVRPVYNDRLQGLMLAFEVAKGMSLSPDASHRREFLGHVNRLKVLVNFLINRYGAKTGAWFDLRSQIAEFLQEQSTESTLDERTMIDECRTPELRDEDRSAYDEGAGPDQ